ncbi:hypothetical protein SAMN02799636_06007 [Methylobacterium sp. 275MFSha3.1]|nr:hypothetical protein SAMN02799636_06007 [Methylobacterium sp. 275MFSha3.1]
MIPHLTHPHRVDAGRLLRAFAAVPGSGRGRATITGGGVARIHLPGLKEPRP